MDSPSGLRQRAWIADIQAPRASVGLFRLKPINRVDVNQRTHDTSIEPIHYKQLPPPGSLRRRKFMRSSIGSASRRRMRSWSCRRDSAGSAASVSSLLGCRFVRRLAGATRVLVDDRLFMADVSFEAPSCAVPLHVPRGNRGVLRARATPRDRGCVPPLAYWR